MVAPGTHSDNVIFYSSLVTFLPLRCYTEAGLPYTHHTTPTKENYCKMLEFSPIAHVKKVSFQYFAVFHNIQLQIYHISMKPLIFNMLYDRRGHF